MSVACEKCQRSVGRRTPLASILKATQPWTLPLVPFHSQNVETVANAFVKECVTLFGPLKAKFVSALLETLIVG